MLSNQLQGFPALTPILDYRTADPKPFVKLYTGLVPAAAVNQRCHVLAVSPNSDEQVFGVPTLNYQNVSANVESAPSLPVSISPSAAYQPLTAFGPTIKVTLGDLLYGRSGDKGSNVNVGFFFPANHQSEDRWQWLRTWLSTERLIGRSEHVVITILRHG